MLDERRISFSALRQYFGQSVDQTTNPRKPIMNIIQRIVQIFVERTVPLVTSLLASRLEGLIALEQAEHQDELEERARQFEQDGKPLLAAALRARAARIDPDKPGFQGLSIIQHLEADSSDATVSLLESAPATDRAAPPCDEAVEDPDPKMQIRRPRRRMVAE